MQFHKTHQMLLLRFLGVFVALRIHNKSEPRKSPETQVHFAHSHSIGLWLAMRAQTGLYESDKHTSQHAHQECAHMHACVHVPQIQSGVLNRLSLSLNLTPLFVHSFFLLSITKTSSAACWSVAANRVIASYIESLLLIYTYSYIIEHCKSQAKKKTHKHIYIIWVRKCACVSDVSAWTGSTRIRKPIRLWAHILLAIYIYSLLERQQMQVIAFDRICELAALMLLSAIRNKQLLTTKMRNSVIDGVGLVVLRWG